MYDRSESTTCHEIDRWSEGVGWLAHPGEDGQRASHPVRDEAGDVWLFDPIDAPGVDDLIADLTDEDGEIAGVVVFSDYHARDADAFARRYEVPVHAPASVDRAAKRVVAPVERFESSIAGFEIRGIESLSAWHEAIAYRERDRTLYVPDSLSLIAKFTVGDERIGLPTASRLRPPRERFDRMTPERIVFGHGAGIMADGDEVLQDTFDDARRRLPRALITNLPAELRAMLGALD